MPHHAGKPMADDGSVRQTSAVSDIVQADTAAAQEEELKRGKYSDLSPHFLFYPSGFESLGSFGPQTQVFVSEIGRILRRERADPRATEFLRQRLSSEVQRGNAAGILGSRPLSKGLDDLLF